ncbi:NAD(P)-binding protein [Marasmius fiardii PR-910]|nr:NAD(P)-binding protein [Marasmius fiardii PR-910]
MRAIVVKEVAHHTQIPIANDVPEPTASENQLLVDVYSTGLNFFDILQAQGKHQSKPKIPFVLGTEFAGKISQNSPIPEGCKFKRGERVFGAGQGAFADQIAVYPEQILPLPDNLTYDEGAGLYVTWPTAYEGLVGRAGMKSGEWVLVTAAAGGVGIAAVQLAKILGGKVIAAAGSEAKMEVAKHYGGADFVVNYSKSGWQKEVSNITGGKGVDVVYDPVGRIQDSFKCIAWKGRAVVIGFAGGDIEKVPTNLILLKNISVTGLHWGAYRIHEPGQIDVVWNDILGLFKSGKVKPVTYTDIYPFDKISDALSALEHRKTWGKVIVRVREDDRKAKSKL